MAKKQLQKTSSLAQLTSKYEGSGVASESLVDYDDQLWVPCSDPAMTALLGGGALYGRIMEIAGQESSGKTLLAMDLVKVAQRLGGVGIFVDAELAFSHTWAELNGLDLEDLFLFPEMAIEVISDFVAESCYYYRSELTHNEPIVLVIDSVAALDTLASVQVSKKDKKAEMGNRAKVFYEMIRLRNRLWAKLGIVVIFINQLRDKINVGFGAQFKEKQTTVGGNALKFFATQRVWLEAKKQLTIGSKERKRRVGIEVLVTLKKNKIAIPSIPTRITVCFDPDYDVLGFHGNDKIADILLARGTMTKSGNSIKFKDEIIATGMSAFLKWLKDSDNLEDALYESEIVTIAQMEERLEALHDDNQFPVAGVDFAVSGGKDDEEEEEND